LKISIVYHQDYYQPKSGGILSYVQQLIEFAPPQFSFIYWSENSKEETLTLGKNTLVTENCIPPNKRISFLPKTVSNMYWIFRNRKRIYQESDIVFVQENAYIVPFLFSKMRCPLVFISHGSTKGLDKYLSKKRYYSHRFFDYVASKKCDLFLTVSKEGYSYYTTLYPSKKEKICYFPTYADERYFFRGSMEDAKKELGLSDKTVIVFVGRLDYQKRVELCLEVFKKVSEKISNAYLCIVGDGTLREELESLSKKLGIQDRCMFYGTVDRKKVKVFFQSAVFSMCLSRWEGTPISVLESLMCGTPVLGSNVGDNPEIIHNDVSGYLVDPEKDSVEQISDKALEIIKYHEKLNNGAIQLSANYRASRIVPEILAKLSTLVKQ
jgi:glycosyltransferase involved in cell wall biosynthesis